MSNRSALCAERAAIERVSSRLAAIEACVPSRNAAYLIGRARTMTDAAGAILAQALSHHVDAVVDVAAGAAHHQ